MRGFRLYWEQRAGKVIIFQITLGGAFQCEFGLFKIHNCQNNSLLYMHISCRK